jgi:transposase
VMSRGTYRELKLLVRRHRAAHVVVQRARMVLMARGGMGTREIARSIGTDERTVRKWKNRFRRAPTLAGLEDAPRSGRPSRVPLDVRCALIRLACHRPDALKTPFREIWTYASLADRLQVETGHRISTSEVGRILRFEDLRPHRVKQWLHSSDPDFTAKAKTICDLYLKAPRDAVVLCVDEKPMQALERKHPDRRDSKGRVRREFEYKRHGVSALLAAFDIRTGEVFGRVVPHRTAKALVEFLEAIARKHPGKQVYVVWDNLNIHYDGNDERWTAFNRRHAGRFRFRYTPKHASWMNQVEIWFSILQRRVIRYGDFPSVAVLREKVLGFLAHWNRWERHPFRWTWRSETRQNVRRAA